MGERGGNNDNFIQKFDVVINLFCTDRSFLIVIKAIYLFFSIMMHGIFIHLNV